MFFPRVVVLRFVSFILRLVAWKLHAGTRFVNKYVSSSLSDLSRRFYFNSRDDRIISRSVLVFIIRVVEVVLLDRSEEVRTIWVDVV